MTEDAKKNTDLLERPEPHFDEGRAFPQPGWQGCVLWSGLVVLLASALLAAGLTEMVVHVSLSGSVVREDGRRLAAVLVAEPQAAAGIKIGQPVRLRTEKGGGWGVVVSMGETSGDDGSAYVRAVVAIAGPQSLVTVPGQTCEGHVLVGFVRTIDGLWRLATNQPTRPTHGSLPELHERIPPEVRATQWYRTIERKLGEGAGARGGRVTR